jgi:hypothetical protein
MTQYNETVERQRLKLEAEDWALGVRSLHGHRLSSMWYDDRPQDTSEGKYVMDLERNGGHIERTIYDSEGNECGKHQFGETLKGDALIDSYCKHT